MTHSRVRIFEVLKGEDLERIAPFVEEKSYKKETTVFGKGEEARGLYFIKEGRVQVLIKGRRLAQVVGRGLRSTRPAPKKSGVGRVILFGGAQTYHAHYAALPGLLHRKLISCPTLCPERCEARTAYQPPITSA